ncbi:hypothetical protein AB3S75_046482 [Citrus x aurantiifolia]
MKEVWIHRSPPVWPWCKINSDSSCKRSGFSSAGGIIRDYNGKWIRGFGLNIGLVVARLRLLSFGVFIKVCCVKVGGHKASVDLQKIHTKENRADVLTKPINTDKFVWSRSSCGLAET